MQSYELRRRCAPQVRAPCSLWALLTAAAVLLQPLCCLFCSTLDPVLRGEVHGFDWKAFLVLATASLYFFATPGAKHPNSTATAQAVAHTTFTRSQVPAQQLTSLRETCQALFCEQQQADQRS
jgi:hypothetical protein